MNAMTPITTSVATSGSTEVSTFDFSYGIDGRRGPAGRSANFPVRVVQIDGDPWFVAADVCKAIALTNPSVSVKPLDADEKAKKFLGSGKPANLVSESGLYKLILRAHPNVNPAVKKFQDWVTRDVLPTIRKTGQYNTSAAAVAAGEMRFAEMTAKVMQGLLEQVELEKKKAEKLEHRNKSLTKVNASLTDELHYVTVREFLDHHLGIYAAPGLSVRLGQAATKICKNRGYELRQEDKELVNKGKVIISSINVYPHEVLLEAWEKGVRIFYEAQKVAA